MTPEEAGRWVRVRAGEWRTSDGRYEVWRQSRLHNGEQEWAASVTEKGTVIWLTATAANAHEAKTICNTHARLRTDPGAEAEA